MTDTVDWAKDYDIFDPEYVEDPYPVWDELRETCPIAHTDRWGGSWLPVAIRRRAAIAHDVEHFSSREVSVVPSIRGGRTAASDRRSADLVRPAGPHVVTPPLAAVVLAPKRSRSTSRPPASCAAASSTASPTRGRADAAVDYAQQIPARVIAAVLGVPPDMADTFTGWVRDVLEFAHDPERRGAGRAAISSPTSTSRSRTGATNPGDDLISELLHTEVDGDRSPTDTSWARRRSRSSPASTRPGARSAPPSGTSRPTTDDRAPPRRRSPSCIPIAIEELLRAYSPVTMARIVAERRRGRRLPDAARATASC